MTHGCLGFMTSSYGCLVRVSRTGVSYGCLGFLTHDAYTTGLSASLGFMTYECFLLMSLVSVVISSKGEVKYDEELEMSTKQYTLGRTGLIITPQKPHRFSDIFRTCHAHARDHPVAYTGGIRCDKNTGGQKFGKVVNFCGKALHDPRYTPRDSWFTFGFYVACRVKHVLCGNGSGRSGCRKEPTGPDQVT